jgi:hypothetical protein
MYYSYVEIEYIATIFSPARTDLALKLLIATYSKDFILNGVTDELLAVEEDDNGGSTMRRGQ